MNFTNESSFITTATNNDELIEKLMKTIGTSTQKISQNGRLKRRGKIYLNLNFFLNLSDSNG